MAENSKKKRGPGRPFPEGKSGNAGGLTKHQAQVRRDLHTWLASDVVTPTFKKSYLKALQEGDTTILRDCADRLLGKVKLPVDLGEDGDRPLFGVAADAIIDALKGKS